MSEHPPFDRDKIGLTHPDWDGGLLPDMEEFHTSGRHIIHQARFPVEPGEDPNPHELMAVRQFLKNKTKGAKVIDRRWFRLPLDGKEYYVIAAVCERQ